ncbi:MAG: hypothetical protein M0Z87_07255 [Actinomycetota bacterium]|nr:hypothetical protein [Actinomycetota bacterium]
MSSPSDTRSPDTGPPDAALAGRGAGGRPAVTHVVIGSGGGDFAQRLLPPGGAVVHLSGGAGDGRRLLELAAADGTVVYWPWPEVSGSAS